MLTRDDREPRVAYFSMEVGIDPAMPTYSGGLGVLAGDTLRSAADMGLPLVGVTLLHRKGYFRQHIDEWGNQSESPAEWSPEEHLQVLPNVVSVAVEGRQVRIRGWVYSVKGVFGHKVPVYFLDTALAENTPWDQRLTDHLYGGDDRYRLSQEVVLGLGGVAMLRALGHSGVQAYHMNEGHSALLVLALLAERNDAHGGHVPSNEVREAVRKQCVFTTHTPVPAGHDKFPVDLVRRVLGAEQTELLASADCFLDGELNMTHLALVFSRYINGVSMRHEEISRGMFPSYPINSITNGVHALTWTSEPFSVLYDRHIPEWRHDNNYLRYIVAIPLDEIQRAHAQAKEQLLTAVAQRTGLALDSQMMTLGFARRATGYKRADLLFSDIERLRAIAQHVGPLQIIYGGKAHPRDESGKTLIQRIHQAASALRSDIRTVYLEEYDMALAKYVCSGVDLWLNTPLKPHEASGTSGMKAALNGVPSLSVLDGWWIEGHVEGVTGWSIGDRSETGSDTWAEATSLYDKLERLIIPTYYRQPIEYAKVMRWAIALNGSYYNAQRMMFQYLENAYMSSGA